MNKNYELRDQIIFGNCDDYSYDVKHFTNLTLTQLLKLIELDFIELDECQNYSPTTEEILEFIGKYPQYVAHGYVVNIRRSDYRTTLEGVYKQGKFDSEKEHKDFYELFSEADELIVNNNEIYCWYD